MRTFKEIPFTNNIGQVINVGDRVICVSTGYSHQVGVREGVYTGCTVNDRGDVTSVQVLAKVNVFGRWWPDGRRASWSDKHPDVSDYERRDIMRKSSLPRKRIYALK